MTPMIWRCNLVPQYEAYQSEINEAIQRVLHSGKYVLGENVAAFETEFSDYLGGGYSVGVNSGTDALMLALWCLNLQPGDEVITTPFTAIPTYSAIRHVGAKPVFVDIDPETFLMDLNQVARVINNRTRAIIPVHLFGNAVDIELLRTIVGRDIIILEDCAQSHGAAVRGKMCGVLGDVAAFSFFPTKNLGGYGDGGMVVAKSKEFADEVKLRRMYGMISKDEFVTDGINSRLDELQAAILRVKLRHLDQMNDRRAELAVLYKNLLPADHIHPQTVQDDIKSVWHVYCAVSSGRRDELVQYLEANYVQTNVYYPMPLSKQKGYQAVYDTAFNLPVAEEISRRIIALPFYPEIPEEFLERTARLISEFYQS